jgi:hypothetical protein
MLLKEAFNLYMLLCGNDAVRQKTVTGLWPVTQCININVNMLTLLRFINWTQLITILIWICYFVTISIKKSSLSTKLDCLLFLMGNFVIKDKICRNKEQQNGGPKKI